MGCGSKSGCGVDGGAFSWWKNPENGGTPVGLPGGSVGWVREGAGAGWERWVGKWVSQKACKIFDSMAFVEPGERGAGKRAWAAFLNRLEIQK